ncbi:hypothetical protein [Enterobacter kobei]|uniref:hypothetical protein n=1 Tax=Enterobacter kobei TaxID=208224 RepID=UPI002FD5A6CD
MNTKVKVKEKRRAKVVAGKTTCKKQAAVMHIKKGHIQISENGVNLLCLSAF